MGSSCCSMSDSTSDDTSPFGSDDYTNRSYNDQSSPQRQAQGLHIAGAQNAQHRRPVSFLPTASPLQIGNSQLDISSEQMMRARRQGIIHQIPSGLYKPNLVKQCTECPICIIDFEVGDEVKYLPCMHIYHKHCIDDWLMRCLRCPSCMEPVDAALVSSFDSFASI